MKHLVICAALVLLAATTTPYPSPSDKQWPMNFCEARHLGHLQGIQHTPQWHGAMALTDVIICADKHGSQAFFVWTGHRWVQVSSFEVAQ
jgi:outer membrane biogenesis lipoprotein LolB